MKLREKQGLIRLLSPKMRTNGNDITSWWRSENCKTTQVFDEVLLLTTFKDFAITTDLSDIKLLIVDSTNNLTIGSWVSWNHLFRVKSHKCWHMYQNEQGKYMADNGKLGMSALIYFFVVFFKIVYKLHPSYYHGVECHNEQQFPEFYLIQKWIPLKNS